MSKPIQFSGLDVEVTAEYAHVERKLWDQIAGGLGVPAEQPEPMTTARLEALGHTILSLSTSRAVNDLRAERATWAEISFVRHSADTPDGESPFTTAWNRVRRRADGLLDVLDLPADLPGFVSRRVAPESVARWAIPADMPDPVGRDGHLDFARALARPGLPDAAPLLIYADFLDDHGHWAADDIRAAGELFAEAAEFVGPWLPIGGCPGREVRVEGGLVQVAAPCSLPGDWLSNARFSGRTVTLIGPLPGYQSRTVLQVSEDGDTALPPKIVWAYWQREFGPRFVKPEPVWRLH